MSADAQLDEPPRDLLPQNIAVAFAAFIEAARRALADDLVSATLFGSAAEGQLSPTSDVNLLIVMRSFAPERIADLRDALLAAEAAIKLRVMLVLESELPAAAELFAQKFADMLRRHRTIVGKDVLTALRIPRAAEIFRLRQVLLNLVLRLREAYASRGHRPEQVGRVLADAVGPLRAACATLLELEGASAVDSASALTHLASTLGAQEPVAQMLAAHASRPIGADDTLLRVIAFTGALGERATRLQ